MSSRGSNLFSLEHAQGVVVFDSFVLRDRGKGCFQGGN